jgi:hypothetical protein
MLVVVGERARQGYDDAKSKDDAATRTTSEAQKSYSQAQAAVTAAEANLLNSQKTLKLVTEAAITPGAAAATPLPNLTGATNLDLGVAPSPGATGATGATATTLATTTTTTRRGGVETAAVSVPAPVSPTIMGQPILNAAALAAWYQSLGRPANTTIPIDQLATAYDQWGQVLGVRDDLAFAQSIVETGFFSFPAGGQLTPKDNNFAGIGACDTCAHGWTFPSADQGVQAQLELLHLYATSNPWPKTIPNVIGATSVGGCCDTWAKLAGTWASSTVYGISIMTVYHQMLTWLIPQQELSVGLIAPSNPAAKGPELAPLPGTPKPAPAKPAPAKAATANGVAAASTGRHG